jgi:hypothetical protein
MTSIAKLLPTESYFSSDEEDDNINEMSLIIPEEECQSMILLTNRDNHSFHKANMIIEAAKNTDTLWKVLLDYVVKNMQINDIYYSKELIIIIAVFTYRYRNFKEYLVDPFYILLWNKIINLIETKLPFPKHEVFLNIPCSLRWENEKVVFYECRYFIPSERLSKKEEAMFIIQDNLKNYDYVMKKTLFERRANDKLIKKFFEKFRSLAESPYDYANKTVSPLIHLLQNIGLLSQKLDIFGEWN